MKNINFDSNQDFQSRAKAIKNIMLELDIANAKLIKGCSQSEILKLEQEYNVIFPKSYKVFLKNFGHGLGGGIMKDVDILYDSLTSLTNIARNEILVEKGDPKLPAKAFIFAMRYGEQFMFFDASGLIEEPPIFYYMEDDVKFTKIGSSVLDIIEKAVLSSKEAKHKN